MCFQIPSFPFSKMIDMKLTLWTDGCFNHGVSVVHFDRLILRHYFSKFTFQTHQLKPALPREPRFSMVSSDTPVSHKEMQDEENGSQMSSGFVWSEVITTFRQPHPAELIHKGKTV